MLSENDNYGLYLCSLAHFEKLSIGNDMLAETLQCVAAWKAVGLPMSVVNDHNDAESLTRNVFLLKSIQVSCRRNRGNHFVSDDLITGGPQHSKRVNKQLNWLCAHGLISQVSSFPTTIIVSNLGASLLLSIEKGLPPHRH
jgi:hypothetical protein